MPTLVHPPLDKPHDHYKTHLYNYRSKYFTIARIANDIHMKRRVYHLESCFERTLGIIIP